jgi:hypothetical protein
MTENIYDLSKLNIAYSQNTNGGEVANSYSTLLKGYELVDRAVWDKIPRRSHIRYLRTDGKFVKGGFVTSISHTTGIDGKHTFMINLASNLSFNNAKPWSIYQNNIEKIWKKIDTGIPDIQSQQQPQQQSQPYAQSVSLEEFNELKEKVDKYEEYFRHIKIDMQRIKDEASSIVKVIKTFHPPPKKL